MERRSILVRAVWDPEAEVWVATSDDVPGLVTEAATHDELQRKLHVMIPELLDEDGNGDNTIEVPLFVMSEQLSKIRVRAD